MGAPQMAIKENLAGQTYVDGNEMDLGVTVLSSLGGGHVYDLSD